MDAFRYHLQAQNLSPQTTRNYADNARRFVTWCHAHEIDYRAATRDVITFYVGELAGRCKQSTVSLALLCLRYYYDYLVAEGVCETNPARQVKYRKPESPPTQPLSEAELRRMFNACQNYREQAVFLLLAAGGLRRSEVFHLRKADIDFEHGSISILGKGAKYRAIMPGETVIESLRQALAFDEALCPYARDDYVERVVQRLATKAGIRGRIYPHRFRHTFASEFLTAGGTVDELMAILGHARPEQSMYYARASKERRALEKMRKLDIGGRFSRGAE